MSFTQALYDWLGRRLNADEVAAANAAVVSSIDQIRWMELARQIGVSYVSAAIQACEFRFYNEKGERDREAEWLWNVSPNRNQSATEVKDAIVGQMFARGESMMLPLHSRGAVSLIMADSWNPQDCELGAVQLYDGVSARGKPTGRKWSASQVYLFNLDATPNKTFTVLQNTMQTAYNKLAESASAAYLDGNVRRYKWKRQSTPAGDAEKMAEVQAAMEKAVKQFVTAENVAVWPEYNGNELSDFSQPSQTANPSQDFISIRKDMFETIATVMRMPVSMLYGNTNNFDQVFESFITFAVEPVAHVIETEATRKTYTFGQWAQGARCEVDTHHIKHQDLYGAADKIDKLIGDRILSVNDVHADFGLPLINEPWADEYVMTKNLEVVKGGNQNEG